MIDALARAGTDNAEAIRIWRRNLGPDPWHYRLHDAIAATEATVTRISQIVLSLLRVRSGRSAGSRHK